jgi:hypothetical protein
LLSRFLLNPSCDAIPFLAQRLGGAIGLALLVDLLSADGSSAAAGGALSPTWPDKPEQVLTGTVVANRPIGAVGQ